MGILEGLLDKLGLQNLLASRDPLRILVLDDDTLRHEWFKKRFKGDLIDTAVEPVHAVELLSANSYDVVFLDHDLLPEHYNSDETDDERTGYAVARWLASRPDRQAASSIIVHTRNADGALRMVELLRRVGRPAEHVPFHVLGPKVKTYWRR